MAITLSYHCQDTGGIQCQPRPNPTRTVRLAAVTAAIGFVAIAIFELALAAGAPLGHAAWGGAHAHLSTAQRIASAVAVLVWTAAALIVLGRAGLWSAGKRARLFRRGTWFLAGVSVIAALTNFASHSHYENLIFGPIAVILAVLCTIVARSAPTIAPPDTRTAHKHRPPRPRRAIDPRMHLRDAGILPTLRDPRSGASSAQRSPSSTRCVGWLCEMAAPGVQRSQA